MDKIKVLVVDDDLAWAKVMNSFLNKQEDIIVVATAKNKEEAIKLAHDIEIDVILMDINLTGNQRDGVIAAIEIQEFSTSKIIMLTSLNDQEIIKDSFTVGAVDYISKEDYLDIPRAVRKTFYGNSPYQVVLEDYVRLKREEQLKDLTAAEREIFNLIEQGYTQAQIEEKLIKTKNTLRTQIKKIIKKLGVSSSKEAIKKVKTKGILLKEDYIKQK